MHDKKSISIYSLKYVYDKQSIKFNPKILKIKNKKSKRKITCTYSNDEHQRKAKEEENMYTSSINLYLRVN